MDNWVLIAIVISCLWGTGMIGYKMGYRGGEKDANEAWKKTHLLFRMLSKADMRKKNRLYSERINWLIAQNWRMKDENKLTES